MGGMVRALAVDMVPNLIESAPKSSIRQFWRSVRNLDAVQ